jgi:hypothetical protein
MLEYNNHKKAMENIKLLMETVSKEVKKGWVLVPPLEAHHHLPHAIIFLMGIAEQLNYMLDGSTPQRTE